MKIDLEKMKEEILQDKIQIFDVREQEEWEQGHLKGAILVPLSQLGEGVPFDELDRDKKTYLHCRSGNRVQMATPLLKNLGFKKIIPMDEGFDELVSEGFEKW